MSFEPKGARAALEQAQELSRVEADEGDYHAAWGRLYRANKVALAAQERNNA